MDIDCHKCCTKHQQLSCIHMRSNKLTFLLKITVHCCSLFFSILYLPAELLNQVFKCHLNIRLTILYLYLYGSQLHFTSRLVKLTYLVNSAHKQTTMVSHCLINISTLLNSPQAVWSVLYHIIYYMQLYVK